MNQLSAAAFGLGLVLGTVACSSSKSSSDFTGPNGSGEGSGSSGSAAASGGSTGTTGTGNLGNGNNNGQLGGGLSGTSVSNNLDGGATGLLTADGSAVPSAIAATIRDFRFYDAGDPTTDPDFENPPVNTEEDGGMRIGYAGPWDDPNIVTNTLGDDQKPVYANPNGTTYTTHGAAFFNMWYNDTPGTNIHVDYPLPITQNADGSYGYDSQTDGQPYNTPGETGDGFFPIDDGTPYATMFGDQGKPHNYSFTVEIHTVFTYRGGEYFQFRGDDDIFVYINKALVINLGGVHQAEPASVMVDTLGLTVGQTYPLDFFSAERHVTGSNIQFTTTLGLQPANPPPR
ncbi:MAG TPA: fibro-slime domain-containing protein [Polyangiaceae bacterium]|nr:fibro-slime domain-containing protein [Polyangiaceae bacterium]